MSKTAVRGEPLTCSVCARAFSRHENLQRHSRTHTKEKPYICPCGRFFSRKDLLTRHERLSHPIAKPPDSHHQRKCYFDAHRMQCESNPSVLRLLVVDGQKNTATSQVLAVNPVPPSTIADPVNSAADLLITSDDALFSGFDDPFLDFTNFMSADELGIDWDALMKDDAPMQLPLSDDNNTDVHQSNPERSDLSSRVPDDYSGDDDFRELKPFKCPWLMPEPDRLRFIGALSPFGEVIPTFVLPTRLSLARYTEGYVDGFSNHHPFVHIPTLNVLSYTRSPELALAFLAIGAQYRYETKTATSLYQASRSIVLERLRRGDLFLPRGASDEAQNDSAIDESSTDYMHPIQALLLLSWYCSWQNTHTLTQECFEYQGLIARSMRQIGIVDVPVVDANSWTEWVRVETDRRTKFFGWCLLNIQSFAYDTPPLLLSRELSLHLPSSCKEWVARDETEWLSARARFPSPITFKQAYSSHLTTVNSVDPVSEVSPMGNYILIHALLQRIHLTQQLAADGPSENIVQNNIHKIERALNRWRHTWRTSSESMLDLQNSYGSLSFTSTALLAAAHIRLHYNLGPWRDLQSSDPDIVATTLREAPLPQRGSHLIYALLHSVHALNIPSQLGISYLSRCTSFSWSIHHALCGLECAAFLSKWLRAVAISQQGSPLSALESRVIRWITRVVREALLSQNETLHLGQQIDRSSMVGGTQLTNQLGYAIVKIWAQMFKSCNSPWPVFGLIGQSLHRYAELIEIDVTLPEEC
ncbi:unnamed protein product [Penicillium salamii]|nr:unnamed protein product [Penicillium salamii]CAG8378088.1 unnamed protein product [Penicillium salamii]